MDSVSSSWQQDRVSRLACARISLIYFWRHGRLPDLANPATFTELVQWRKLHDRDPRFPVFADKLTSKAIVADRIGPEWVIPTYWHGTELPVEPEWKPPFVVKARHGCNQSIFVFTGRENWRDVRRKSRRWMRNDYGFWLDEWLYRQIPRGILVEPFIGNSAKLPIDYKFYVFGGRVEFIQVHLDRAGRHRWILFDRLWQRVSAPSADDPAPPSTVVQMISAAEELGREFDYVRVDLYEVNGKPYFGEMTFYPGSGYDRFDPVSLDAVIGKYWLRAKRPENTASRNKA
ncbi:MAG: ATP-grasp fold amidoligase family protein [Sphingorhabdus sp.]